MSTDCGSEFACANIAVPDCTKMFHFAKFVLSCATSTSVMRLFAAERLFFNDANWSCVGRFNFAAGNANFIRVLDNFSDATNRAVVDGVKLIYAGADSVLGSP